ncbi:MAG: HAMP domain-containing histidine kinase [Acidimicrobiia bacterium]|nr:HAMP domain-containing histidine kinase [Acidimicrobiia bacterium]
MKTHRSGVLGDWSSEVTAVYRSVRRVGFGTGVAIAAGVTLWFAWSPGWIIVGLCAGVVAHSYLTESVRMTRDVTIDATVLGLMTLVIEVPGGWAILTFPIAVAALMGERRTGGIAVAIVAAFLVAPLIAPGWFLLREVEWLPDAFRTSNIPVAERSNIASSILIGFLLLLIWLVSGRIRAIEQRRALALATIAHDLRNATGAIRGLSASLASDPVEVEATAEALVTTADEALHLSADNYALARLQMERFAAEVQEFDLGETVMGTLGGMAEVDVSLEPTTVIGDRNRTAQIVRNLISNAIRHGASPIAVEVRPGATSGLVTVSDSGPGLPPTVEQSLFTHRHTEGDGMGIGLATSSTFADEMGGDLTYRRDGSRTVFELALPLAM